MLVFQEEVAAAQDGHRRRRDVGGREVPFKLELVEVDEAEGQFGREKSEPRPSLDLNTKKSNSVELQIKRN
jgi:hypothetical protein